MPDRSSRYLELMNAFQSGQLDRRSLMRRAAAVGVAAPVAAALTRFDASAQESDATGPSITREEYLAQVREEYPIPEDAVAGGTIVWADISDISTANVILAADSPTLDVLGLVFETLWTTNVLEPEYVPLLADSWELAEDGLTYTFNLNQNATWHDGTAFTSADVILSMDAQTSPDSGSSYQGSFVDTIASYEAVDDHTVTVVATDVFPQLLFFGGAYVPMMAAHIWGEVPFADWLTHPGSTGEDPSLVVGTGPYTFQEWAISETVTLARNEDYREQVPFIEEIVFQVWPDQSSALEALRAGEVDLIEGIPNADAQSVADAETTDLVTYPTYSFNFYAYNLDPEKTQLFQDVEVRQALFYALDRETLIDEIYFGYGEVANGSQPLLSPAYAPDEIETIYNYDPERAMQLLDQAGWVANADTGIREKDGVPLSFELMYTGGVALYNQLVPYMQQAWSEIGVDMIPNPVDFGTVLIPAITENFDYQVVLLGFSWDITGDQGPMFSTDQYINGFNMMRYSNPEVDELFAAAQTEADPEARRDILIEAANLVNDDLPVGIIVFSEARVGYSTRMQNYQPTGNGGFLWNIDTTWLQDA
ncbi:MAG: ABC transporter substrate-binding protein [Thermomicrobiales bacterium]